MVSDPWAQTASRGAAVLACLQFETLQVESLAQEWRSLVQEPVMEAQPVAQGSQQVRLGL